MAPNGDVIVAGEFFGSVDFGGGALNTAGNSDIAVARFDASGNHLWSKRFGDFNEQRVTGIAVDDSGNPWLTGYFVGGLDFGSFDVFVAKLAGDGTHLWSQRYGDSNVQYHYALTVAPDGSLWVLGIFLGVIDFASGGQLVNVGGFDGYWAHLLP